MSKERDKLILYSKCAAAYLLLNSEVSAQAVYTDLEPDIVLSEGDDYFELNMDDSGGYDFVFINWTGTSYTLPSGYLYLERLWVGPYALNYAAVAGISNYISTAGYRYYPFALSANEIINDDLNFQNWFYQRMAFKTTEEDGFEMDGGYWYPEKLDHYLGVRFTDSEDCEHFGWIRCDVLDEGRTLIIKDYGYETKCDVGILAGDTIGDTTTVGIFEINTLDGVVYSFENTIYINLNKLCDDVKVSVFDITGKEIYSNSVHSLFSNFVLDQPANIYFVKLTSGKGELIKKVYIN